MRKLLISVLIVLLLLLTVYSIWKGLSIGSIKILGFNDIKFESEKIDKDIAEITRLKEQNYKKTLSDIESNAKLLLQEKEKYATLVTTSTDSEIEKATHAQKYEQDFLWAKIGNHATAQGVSLKFDIKVGALNKENYDLYFTVNGTYTNITEFVLALENDNLLGFKIENFKLVPGGSAQNTEQKSDNKTNQNTNTNENSNNNTNTNTNSSTNNTTNKNNSSTQTSSSVVSLEATFKVTDISINIDKTKITSTNTEAVANPQGTTNTAATNTVTEGINED